METISPNEAAKLLGISLEKLAILEKQGLIHAIREDQYSAKEIEQIKSRRGMSISEEASQVAAQIQQEVVASVSHLMRLRKRVFILSAFICSCFMLLFTAISLLFYYYPLQTSDFFGYYYRFHAPAQQARLRGEAEKAVLAAATGPGVALSQTTVLADLIKPVAAVSLIAVKAIDAQKYDQIVTNPAEVIGFGGSVGSSGAPGADGFSGTDGINGSPGQSGPQGSIGSGGANGTNGTNGVNGTTSATPISGLTNSNLSGSAGITNANLANSTVSLVGNSGSGLVALGGSLTLTGSGISSVSASGSTLTFSSTEADTLQSVYNRGSTLPTTAGSTLNTIDSATISIGSIASTAQQNFATLNLTNGGTGFLDVELIRGFINFQGMNTLYDDFTSKSLDTADRWTSTSTGAGSSCSILAGGLNGLLRMDSGAGNNRGCELTTQSITSLTDGYYQRGNNPILETKIKIDVVTNARVFAGFTEERVPTTGDTNPDTNHAYIAKRATDTTWQCVTDDGGATETTTSTGVTIVANTFYRLRVELRSGTIPQTICTVDDGTTVVRTVVTATQPGSASPMDVYIKLNQSDNIAKNMDIDYVRAWQDDPPMVITAEGNLEQKPIVSDTVAVSEETATVLVTPVPEEIAASDSAHDGTRTADAVTSMFKNLVAFFGSVIFHGDVMFLGRPTFDTDTAGYAVIKTGDDSVEVFFEKAYSKTPAVIANVNLVGDVQADEIPGYAVYDMSEKGFRIRLVRSSGMDLSFSWIALATHDTSVSQSVSGSSISPQMPPPTVTILPTEPLASPSADTE